MKLRLKSTLASDMVKAIRTVEHNEDIILQIRLYVENVMFTKAGIPKEDYIFLNHEMNFDSKEIYLYYFMESPPPLLLSYKGDVVTVVEE